MQYYTTVVQDVLAILKVNQSIEISFDHTDFLDEYVSRIETLEPDTIGVSMPTKRRVPPGTHCWVYLIRDRQRYGFESVIQGYAKDNIPLMVLSCPCEILRLP
ncbi:MAG: flagellar brake protein [bacterium]|nr:flagellar brake protein [bacterium]